MKWRGYFVGRGHQISFEQVRILRWKAKRPVRHGGEGKLFRFGTFCEFAFDLWLCYFIRTLCNLLASPLKPFFRLNNRWSAAEPFVNLFPFPSACNFSGAPASSGWVIVPQDWDCAFKKLFQDGRSGFIRHFPFVLSPLQFFFFFFGLNVLNKFMQRLNFGGESATNQSHASTKKQKTSENRLVNLMQGFSTRVDGR